MHEDISFWKWINNDTLGVVTDSAVYHWAGTGDSAPVKVFDRHANLAGHQIINYRASSDEKWLVLVGIASNPNPEGFKVKGSLQLYSKERGVSQPIEGHAAAFANIKLENSAVETKLFTFANRTATGAKVSLRHDLTRYVPARSLCFPLYSFTSLKSTTKRMRQSSRRSKSTSSSHLRLPTTSLLQCRFPRGMSYVSYEAVRANRA
jgi:hypothetical protein